MGHYTLRQGRNRDSAALRQDRRAFKGGVKKQYKTLVNIHKMEKNLSKNEKITVVIRDRDALLFEDKVDAISSFNDKGPFDVLPRHANFISLIKKSVVIHLSGKQEKKIEIQSGVLKVKDNNIEIYLGILR